MRSDLNAEVLLAERVAGLWPQHLITFLEERLVWRRTVNFENEPPVENEPTGQAKRITCMFIIKFQYSSKILPFNLILIIMCLFLISDVTNVGSKLQYWVEFDDGSKFVQAKEARKRYSGLIIDYLQPHLIVVDAQPTDRE